MKNHLSNLLILALLLSLINACSFRKSENKKLQSNIVTINDEQDIQDLDNKKTITLPYLAELESQKSLLMNQFKYWSARTLTTDPNETILDLDHSTDGMKLLMITKSKKYYYVYLIDLKQAAMPRLVYKDQREVLWSRFFNENKNILFAVNDKNKTPYLSSLDLNKPINQIPIKLMQTPESQLGISGINKNNAYAIARISKDNNSIELMKDKLIYKKFNKASEPSWSSTGKSLVFMSNIFGQSEIVKYDETLNGLQRITISKGSIHSPGFSPNQKWIIYSSKITGKSNIYAINIRTSTIKRISYLKDMEFTKPIWCSTGSIYAIGTKKNKSYLFQFNHLARSFNLQTNGNPGPTLETITTPVQDAENKILLEN